MTAREKFEARFNRVGNTQQVGVMTEAMFEIYQAGRESMRAEAKAACERFVKQKLMTREQYVSEYDWS